MDRLAWATSAARQSATPDASPALGLPDLAHDSTRVSARRLCRGDSSVRACDGARDVVAHDQRLIDLSLRNRFIVVAVFLGLAGWGWWALRATPIDAIPDLSDNQVIVFTDWPGHSPQEVEDQVTYPLTMNLQGLAGVRVVRSQSAFGFSMIYVDLRGQRRPVLRAEPRARAHEPGHEGAARGRHADARAGRDRRRPRVLVHGREPDAFAARAPHPAGLVRPLPAQRRARASPRSPRSAAMCSSTRSTSIRTALRQYNLPLSAVVSAVRDSNLNVGGNVLEVERRLADRARRRADRVRRRHQADRRRRRRTACRSTSSRSRTCRSATRSGSRRS